MLIAEILGAWLATAILFIVGWARFKRATKGRG